MEDAKDSWLQEDLAEIQGVSHLFELPFAGLIWDITQGHIESVREICGFREDTEDIRWWG